MLKVNLIFTIVFLFSLLSCTSDEFNEKGNPSLEQVNMTAITVNNTTGVKKPFSVNNGVPTPSGKQWKVMPVFSDEFDGPGIDSKWNLDPLGHSDLKWPGRLPALFQKESFKIQNGEMKIKVGKLPAPVTISPYGKPITYTYYGGIMRSNITTNVGVGKYFECRMKMNKTEMGGGFWLMSKNVCGKKHEIDITESVGHITPQTESWARNWNKLYHSNAIRRVTTCNDDVRTQSALALPVKNSEKYYVYGFWWKSSTELLFYIDGEYAYTLVPPQGQLFDQDMYMQFSIESYDWNPIPANGGKVANASLADRTTHLDYIRSYELVDAPPNSQNFFIQNRATEKFIRPQTDAENSPIAQAPSTWKGAYTQWEKVNATNGYFHLKNKETGKFLRPQTNANNSPLVQVATAVNSQWQTQWKTVNSSDGYFYLLNRWTGKYIRPTNNDDLAGNTGNNYRILSVPTSLTWHYTQWKFVNIN